MGWLPMNKGLLLLFLILLKGETEYKLFVPIVGEMDFAANSVTSRIGLAAAWSLSEEEADILDVSMYHNWSLSAPLRWAEDLTYVETYWSDCYPSDMQCDSSYQNRIYHLCNSGWGYSEIERLRWNGKIVITFLNEPEIPGQANDSVSDAVSSYKWITDVCGDQVTVTSPMNAFDKCYFPDGSSGSHLTAVYGIDEPHCWFQEFLTLYQHRYGSLPNIEVLATHAYHSTGWVSNPPTQPTLAEIYDSIAGVYLEFYDAPPPPLVITEFGSCDARYVGSVMEEMKDMPEVIALLGWVANLPPTEPGQCMAYFSPYESAMLTTVGCAFARRDC